MILLDNARLHRTITRMAHQVVEKAAGEPITLVGLNERGYSVASVMKKVIEKQEGNVKLIQLDAGDGKPVKPEVDAPQNILVIVDDVIFSGATIFEAMQKISELPSYKNVFVAAVVDRGHRRLPIQAEIVGITVPTKFYEHVDFQLKDSEPESVKIIKKQDIQT